jgi:hypothetical protein
MILLPTVTVKLIFDVSPGELIAFAFRSHRALGLALSRDDGRVLIGLLKTEEELVDPLPPFAIHIERRSAGRAECLSYGADWVMDLAPSAGSIPGRRSDWNTSGSIYLDADGARIFFKDLAERSFGGGYSFNLSTNELTGDTDTGTPHLSWRIWATEADRDHPSREPLFIFEQAPRAD